MGLFNKKEKVDTSSIADHILITTTENIPGKQYEIVGLVSAKTKDKIAEHDFSNVSSLLKIKAFNLEADAIVAFRAVQYLDVAGIAIQCAYGTAVKYKKTED